MNEGAAEADSAPGKHLHPWSALFMLGEVGRQVAVPLIALAFVGGSWSRASIITAVFVCLLTLWSLLKARAYRYQLDGSALHIRDGLIDRTQRHIPFSRIHNISQRRNLLHRLLNVTELHLESASGTKPEAVIRVLGVNEAAELEALLRGDHAAEAASPALNPGQPAADVASASAPGAVPSTQLLLALPWAEVLRAGIASNRGLVVVVALVGGVSQNDFLRKQAAAVVGPFSRWVTETVTDEAQAAHGLSISLAIAAGVLIAWVLTRVLSVALAFFRYHRFRLECQGEKLLAAHGLSTQVRAAARLSRLQRWQIDETWSHRLMSRTRLRVTVAGGSQKRGGGAHGADPGMQFTELAPIATWAQTQALLAVCLPTLDWDKLQWQPLHTAWIGRLWSQGRWLVPCVGVLLALATVGHLGATVAFSWILAGLTVASWLAYTRGWAQFAAYAIAGPVVVFRSGVWHRRWVIVETSRLHVLRLHSSPLDRRLGVVSFQATAQGGPRSHRTLDIPYMPLAVAQGLRDVVWERISLRDSR